MTNAYFDYAKAPVQILLAPTFHVRTRDHKPGFRRFIEESGLPVPLHSEVSEADLGTRQAPYQRLLERNWSPERWQQEVQS